jgi:hypothetical protein
MDRNIARASLIEFTYGAAIARDTGSSDRTPEKSGSQLSRLACPAAQVVGELALQEEPTANLLKHWESVLVMFVAKPLYAIRKVRRPSAQ